MSLHRALPLLALLLSGTAFAQAQETAAAEVKARVREALSMRLPMPAERPTLPDAASDRAREIQSALAARKAVRGQATEGAANAAAASIQGATANAAKKANADARAADGQGNGRARKTGQGNKP
jgi:hypothetical protein